MMLTVGGASRVFFARSVGFVNYFSCYFTALSLRGVADLHLYGYEIM